MNTVQVLLSTYNGERFLPEQLLSLQQQEYVSVKVLVRDDGSSDGTLNILQSCSYQWSAIEFLKDQNKAVNLGVVGSFFELIKHADESCEYFAFCDQDDVWAAGKLFAATQKLGDISSETPALYFSRLEYVDQNLKPLGQSPVPKILALESALVENVATGCSMVMNRALLNILKNHQPNTSKVLMHDWWVYLVAMVLGKVVYDDKSYVKYRQHEGNVVGASASWVAIYLIKIKRFFGRKCTDTSLTDQAAELLCQILKPTNSKHFKLLEDLLESKKGSLVSRIVYAWRCPLMRQSMLDSFLLRVLIVLGRY